MLYLPTRNGVCRMGSFGRGGPGRRRAPRRAQRPGRAFPCPTRIVPSSHSAAAGAAGALCGAGAAGALCGAAGARGAGRSGCAGAGSSLPGLAPNGQNAFFSFSGFSFFGALGRRRARDGKAQLPGGVRRGGRRRSLDKRRLGQLRFFFGHAGVDRLQALHLFLQQLGQFVAAFRRGGGGRLRSRRRRRGRPGLRRRSGGRGGAAAGCGAGAAGAGVSLASCKNLR